VLALRAGLAYGGGREAIRLRSGGICMMTSPGSNEEEEFDLTDVLGNRMLGLRFDYVLIIEWLFDDDQQTGLALYEWLSVRIPADKIEYARCRSIAELEARLDQARRDVPRRGNPIVHIEAHGEDASHGTVPGGFVGPDGRGGRELLTWERMGDILRPLNVATRFNLLVVGAACYGEGLVLGAAEGRPMPLMAVVGYTDKVSPLSLKHSILELYRSLLLDKMELGLAAEAADAQHYFPSDGVLRTTSMIVLLTESFIMGTAESVKKLRMHFPLDPARADAGPVGHLASLSPTALHILRRVLADAWSMTWMLDEFSENAERFAINGDRLIELAVEYADKH